MANSIFRRDIKFDFSGWAKQLSYVPDPILNFTRASSATRINPQTGLVETVAANVPRLTGRQELWKAGSKNLLKYSNDLQNTAAWALTNLATCVKAEGDAHLISFQVGDGYWGQYVSVPAGTYTLSFKVKTSGVSASARLQLAGVSSPVPVTAEWTTISRTAVWDAGSPYITIREGNGLKGSFLVKDAQLELSSTATTYEPNPVVIQPGLLVEGAATNYIPYSDFSTGVGATAGVTKTSDFATAPDGTVTAARVQYNGSGAAGSYRYYATADTATAGQNRVTSIWLKSNSGTPTLRLNDNNGAWGTITLTTSWRRYYLPGSGQAGSAWQPLIFSPVGDNSAFDILVWGAQLESGSFPTSYTPTAGAAVTRATDNASIDVSKLWNAQEGTIVAAAEFGIISSGYRFLFNNGDTFNLYQNPSGYLSAGNGAISYSPGEYPGNHACVALSYYSGILKMSVNGGTIRQAAFSPLVTTLALGQDLNGTIQNLIYVPYAAPDIVLQKLSQLT